jgi:hypothetical protein
MTAFVLSQFFPLVFGHVTEILIIKIVRVKATEGRDPFLLCKPDNSKLDSLLLECVSVYAIGYWDAS